MSRILLTGDQGFTGKYLRKDLERRGFEVVGLKADLGLDILDGSKLQSKVKNLNLDYACHLAAVSSVTHGRLVDFYNVNVIGTLNLLQALTCNLNIQKVILSSTANLYLGNAYKKLSEDMPIKPSNHYAVSKLAMEEISRQFADDLPITLTRPFNYTGVGQDHKFLVPKIINAFKKRLDVIELGNLDVVRDYSDVRTVSETYCNLLLTERPLNVVNICSGAGHSINEIIEYCCKISGHRPRIVVNSAFVRNNEITRLVGDNTVLRSCLPETAKISLKETLVWMLEN